jgi:hypothetical protein
MNIKSKDFFKLLRLFPKLFSLFKLQHNKKNGRRINAISSLRSLTSWARTVGCLYGSLHTIWDKQCKCIETQTSTF